MTFTEFFQGDARILKAKKKHEKGIEVSETKTEFCVKRIIELIDVVIERECILKDSESYADLGWVKFYVKDLATKCEDCAESQKENK